MTTQQPLEAITNPILALDLGEKRVGVAICDALAISISRIEPIRRGNWKQLLQDVAELVKRFDAKTLVIGLPLRLDGTAGDAAIEIRKTAEKFALSLTIPVYLQDERLTSLAAEENLRSEGASSDEIRRRVDSEAAALILSDFLSPNQERQRVRSTLDNTSPTD